ncbi:MAG: hypothetical protein QM204_00095 [Bacillota bacterium]|jgi:hypothetical protein|nr:hypothetical protein [Bacillota bacterium]NLL26737.1 DUF1461 domain-containing protein [Erysipelotrichia bacterium]
MEKMNLLNNYRGARSTLLAIIVFSVLNCVMLLLEMGYTFLYSMITPQVAIIFAKVFFRGFTSVIIVVMFAIVPIVLYLISYLLSNKDWKWMKVATILFGTDILVMIGFFIFYGFDSSFILDVLFEGLIMFNLVRGTIAGKKLNNDFEVEEIIIENATEVDKDGEVTKVKIYSYNKEYAKKNKAHKNWMVIVSVLVFFLSMFVLASLLNSIFKNNVFLMFIIMYGLLIGYVVWIVKMSPFLNAKNFQYFKKDGIVCRNTVINGMNGVIMPFEDLKVEIKKEDSYICSYQKKENKRKNLVIPDAYPDLDEILKI